MRRSSFRERVALREFKASDDVVGQHSDRFQVDTGGMFKGRSSLRIGVQQLVA